MGIKTFGDVLQDTGVVIGVIGMILGNITVMYIGAIMCLLRNIYDLFIGKIMPLIDVGFIGIFLLLTRDIVIAMVYGSIIGNFMEVAFEYALRMMKKAAFEHESIDHK